MIERGTEVHIGNQIIERQISDALNNCRHDHSKLSQDVIDRLKNYTNWYPDYHLLILQRIRSADWTVTELEALIDG